MNYENGAGVAVMGVSRPKPDHSASLTHHDSRAMFLSPSTSHPSTLFTPCALITSPQNDGKDAEHGS